MIERDGCFANRRYTTRRRLRFPREEMSDAEDRVSVHVGEGSAEIWKTVRSQRPGEIDRARSGVVQLCGSARRRVGAQRSK
jgi:hypothetical protein